MDLFIVILVALALVAVLIPLHWLDLERPTSTTKPNPDDEWSLDLPSHPYGR